MTTVEVFAPAKINLSLHVTGRRADGYHLLDSLVAFADTGDRLQITPGADLSLIVSGIFAKGVPQDARNLVWRAAEGVGWRGQIALEKSLPHGAGIGGGSSDAGAFLNALAGQGVVFPDSLALSLGADVPVCMTASAARMQGIGEEITPVALPRLPALLVRQLRCSRRSRRATMPQCQLRCRCLTVSRIAQAGCRRSATILSPPRSRSHRKSTAR